MHIASSEEIQFYQKCLNLGRRIDGRLCNQMRPFELTHGEDVINTCNGSSRLYLADENFTILAGIKADVVSLQNHTGSLVSLSVTSSLSKNQAPLENEYLNKIIDEITFYFQGLLDKHVGQSKLVLLEKKLGWSVYIDIYINGYIGFANVDHMSYAIRAALKSCRLPELDINLNNISNEYTFSIKGGSICPFADIDVPHLIVGGFNKSQVYFDLTPKESLACEVLFLGSILPSGEILELRKIGKILLNIRRW